MAEAVLALLAIMTMPYALSATLYWLTSRR